MITLALGLGFLWKFIEPILSDSIKQRLKPRDSSQIAKERIYELYKVLGEVKGKTDKFVGALEAFVEGFAANAEPDRNRLNSLRKAARHLMDALPMLVRALDGVNPQLEIHRESIVNEILAYRRSRAAVLSDLERSAAAAGNADRATLDKLLARAKENRRLIDEAIGQMRSFLKEEFPFKESF